MKLRYWYLSFVDEARPVGSRWVGASIVMIPDQGNERDNIVMAVKTAHSWGVNPGGQVAAHLVLINDLPPLVPPPDEMVGVVLTDREALETFSTIWNADNRKAQK